jgi:hypothetical protein
VIDGNELINNQGDGVSLLQDIIDASEKMSRELYHRRAQVFVITEKMAHESLKQGLIEFDLDKNCHRLTDEGMKCVWFIGVRKDCEIYIDRKFSV